MFENSTTLFLGEAYFLPLGFQGEIFQIFFTVIFANILVSFKDECPSLTFEGKTTLLQR
jgi:hypothetical protein